MKNSKTAFLKMEKKMFFHNYLYVFIMFIITKFGENFEEKIDICFFLNVLNKKVKVKNIDNYRDFCPDPPKNEKLKSSVFWMN